MFGAVAAPRLEGLRWPPKFPEPRMKATFSLTKTCFPALSRVVARRLPSATSPLPTTSIGVRLPAVRIENYLISKYCSPWRSMRSSWLGTMSLISKASVAKYVGTMPKVGRAWKLGEFSYTRARSVR